MSNIIGTLPFYLNQPVGATDTTIQVKGLKNTRGVAITAMPSGVALIHVTIEPKSPTNQEIISFTGITDNGSGVVTLTGVTRNLNPVSPFTALTADVPHANNSTCVISNNPQIFQDVVMTNEARTVSAVVTFGASPLVPDAVSANQAVSKSQLDLAVLGTVPPASTTVLGAVRVATDATKTLGTTTMTIASPCVVTFNSHGLTVNDTIRFTTTGALPTGLVVGTTYYVISTGLTANTFQLSLIAGGTAVITTGSQSGTHTLYRTTPYAVNDQDIRIAPNNHATSTGSVSSYGLTLSPTPAALVKGQVYSFVASFTTSGASTLAVAPHASKSIKKLNGTTDLAAGDIVSGMLVTVIYDGTNFQMVNPVATAQAPAVDIQTFTTTGAGTWTKPANAKKVEVYVFGAGGAGGGGGGTGGGGGGGGGFGKRTFVAAALGSTENLTVGAKGTGNINATGTAGGATTFGTVTLLRASGGSGGVHGGGGGAGGAGGTSNGEVFQSGGAGSGAGSVGISTATDISPRGGGGFNAIGGGFITNYVLAGGTVSAPGNPGAAGSTSFIIGGTGGAGSSTNADSAAGFGGNGGAIGAGGGGSGNGTTVPKGGDGGDGAVIVVTYF